MINSITYINRWFEKKFEKKTAQDWSEPFVEGQMWLQFNSMACHYRKANNIDDVGELTALLMHKVEEKRFEHCEIQKIASSLRHQ